MANMEERKDQKIILNSGLASTPTTTTSTSIFQEIQWYSIDSINDYIKYQIFPLSYKMIYDRIFRPDIYAQVNSNSIYNIRHNNNNLKGGMCKINSFFNREENIVEKDKTIQEFLILQHYGNAYNDLITSASFIGVLLFTKMLKYIGLKQINEILSPFIFIDNNRLIFNKIIKKLNRLKNLFLAFNISFSIISLFYLARFLYKSKWVRLKEDTNFQDALNKRVFILYENL